MKYDLDKLIDWMLINIYSLVIAGMYKDLNYKLGFDNGLSQPFADGKISCSSVFARRQDTTGGHLQHARTHC